MITACYRDTEMTEGNSLEFILPQRINQLHHPLSMNSLISSAICSSVSLWHFSNRSLGGNFSSFLEDREA
jgi:hypothetical protein